VLPPTTTLRFANAGLDDIGAVTQLFGALHAFNASLDSRFALAAGWEALLEQHFRRTVAAEGALWLLAWEGDEAVGLLLMESHQDSPLFQYRQWAELVALYVSPDYQGQGLAEQLVDAGRSWAGLHGFDCVQLYVTATNVRARRFYARQGFVPTQEIWRLHVEAAPGIAPPDDPACHGADGHSAHPTELGRHSLEV
jgi:ribosomal protein S18 acetylase RimI-like enzyme